MVIFSFVVGRWRTKILFKKKWFCENLSFLTRTTSWPLLASVDTSTGTHSSGDKVSLLRIMTTPEIKCRMELYKYKIINVLINFPLKQIHIPIILSYINNYPINWPEPVLKRNSSVAFRIVKATKSPWPSAFCAEYKTTESFNTFRGLIRILTLNRSLWRAVSLYAIYEELSPWNKEENPTPVINQLAYPFIDHHQNHGK